MSSYGDKRNRRPGCRVPDCERPGILLAIRDGILGWYCESHAPNHK